MGYYEDRFKKILKDEGMTQKEFSVIFGMNYDSLRRALWRGGSRWVEAFVRGYEMAVIVSGGIPKGRNNKN